jgi:hypothetical protein
MGNRQYSDYRGYSIITRWTQLRLPTDDSPALFDASFTVEPDAVDEHSWQQFPRAVFGTCAEAVANAVTNARTSIDLDLKAMGRLS